MSDSYSKKDEIYLKNVQKIGNSIENIHIINNVISKKEHKQLLNFAINIKEWEKQPWDVYSFFSPKMPLEIVNILSKIFKTAQDYFTKLYDIDINTQQKFNIIKFEEGYSMHLHADVLSYAQLHIASVYYINDDYEGGEINFPDHNLTIKPEANSLILFPGNENYWHQTFKVIGKNRYTSTKFFQFTGSTFYGQQGNGKNTYKELKNTEK